MTTIINHDNPRSIQTKQDQPRSNQGQLNKKTEFGTDCLGLVLVLELVAFPSGNVVFLPGLEAAPVSANEDRIESICAHGMVINPILSLRSLV